MEIEELAKTMLPQPKDGPRVELHTIPPETCARILETRNLDNRPLNAIYAKVLTVSMRRRDWRLTSQCIGFDRNGRLIDGQHRLLAAKTAEVALTTFVALNLDPEAFACIDTGMKRRLSFSCGLHPDIADVVAAAARIVYGTNQVTPQQVSDMAMTMLPKFAQAIRDGAGTKRRYFSTAQMRLAACIAMMDGCDPEYVMSQYRALVAMDFNAMSPITQCLVKQYQNGKTHSTLGLGNVLARAFVVFDPANAHLTKLYGEGRLGERPAEAIQRVRTLMTAELNGVMMRRSQAEAE